MRKTLIMLAAMGLMAVSSAAQNAPKATVDKKAVQQSQRLDPARLEAARKLLKVTNSDKLPEQLVQMMMAQIARTFIRSNPGKKTDIVQILRGVVKEQTTPETMNRLREELARIHAREFTTDEMKKIIAFFETPEGKKFVQKMPRIMALSQRAGMMWSREVGRKIIQETRKKAEAAGIIPGKK